MAAAVTRDAVRRVQALDRDRIFGCFGLRKAALRASAAVLAVVFIGAFSAPRAADAIRLAAIYLFPERLALEVAPGEREGACRRLAARRRADLRIDRRRAGPPDGRRHRSD